MLASLNEGYFGSAQNTAEWRTAQSNLRYIRDESERLGASFALVIFPMLYSLDGDYPLANVVAEIARFGEQERMPTLSLLPAYTGQYGPDLWVSPLNQHPNKAGHKIAADEIFSFLQQELNAGK